MPPPRGMTKSKKPNREGPVMDPEDPVFIKEAVANMTQINALSSSRERMTRILALTASTSTRTVMAKQQPLTQMALNMDALWRALIGDIEQRQRATQSALDAQTNLVSSLRAENERLTAEARQANEEAAAVRAELVTLVAEREDFQGALVRAEQAAVAATAEHHHLLEELNNISVQYTQWEKERALEHYNLTEELRRCRAELREVRSRARGMRVDNMKLNSKVLKLQDGLPEGTIPGILDSQPRPNQYLMDMTAEERLRAASRVPTRAVFEFKPAPQRAHNDRPSLAKVITRNASRRQVQV